jgi:hypothetical protein
VSVAFGLFCVATCGLFVDIVFGLTRPVLDVFTCVVIVDIDFGLGFGVGGFGVAVFRAVLAIISRAFFLLLTLVSFVLPSLVGLLRH